MINHWGKLCLAGFVCATVALAAPAGKAPSMSGSFEGGLGWGVQSGGGGNGMHMFVDGVTMNHNFDISDKTKVVVNNMFAYSSPMKAVYVGVPTAFGFDGSGYTSGATIAGGGFVFSNLAAYIQHECAKNVFMSVGNQKGLLGIESLGSRYDMHSYYYSVGYNAAQAGGMNYDLALKVHLVDILPGNFEFAVVDGRVAGAGLNTPGIAARWHYNAKMGDGTLTPVLSTVLQNWNGGPKTFGITGGFMYKMGAFWANAEWFYTRVAGTNVWNINAEPGFEVGGMDLSLKYNFARFDTLGVTDHYGAIAISKSYDDKMRMKLTYAMGNIAENAGKRFHDFRLLWATKW